MYQSGKIFKNVASVHYRQWRADSHCNFGHGYGLSFGYAFESNDLDDRNWIVDFGGLKELKATIEHNFDHKTLVAEDDPCLSWYRDGHNLGAINLLIVPNLSCECFAKMGFNLADAWKQRNNIPSTIVSCQVWEHESNWAKYINPELDITKRATAEADFDYAALQELRRYSK